MRRLGQSGFAPHRSYRHGRIAVYGEVLFDQFEDGATVLGGAPLNVAWHLQQFGQNPLLISRIGQDHTDRELTRTLIRSGLDLSGLQHDATYPTGKVNVTIHNGEPRFEILDHQAYDYIEPGPMLNTTHKDIGLLYHGSLALRHDFGRHSLDAIKQSWQVPVFIDLNIREPHWHSDWFDEIMRYARYLKLSLAELQQINEQGTQSDPHLMAHSLITEYDLDAVLVTMGDHGAWAVTSDQRVKQPAYDAGQIADTVGAGDAFTAAAMLGIQKNWDWQHTLELACEYAALSCSWQGAIPDDPEPCRTFRVNHLSRAEPSG